MQKGKWRPLKLTLTAAINEQNRSVVHIWHRMAFHRIQIPMQERYQKGHLQNYVCTQTLFLSLTLNPALLTRCSTIGKCPLRAALWSAVSFASVRSNMWTPILGARQRATPTWPHSADRWKPLSPPYGCTYNISKIQYILTYVDLRLDTTSKWLLHHTAM